MGVAVGDFDNDGYPDLVVLGYGRSILYRNNGDGTFTDVTARAGVANAGKWASSAAWFDYDNDGRLDLVIANYVDWTPARNYYCGAQGAGMRSYCHPNDYHGVAPTLYHNNGDGTFTRRRRIFGFGKEPCPTASAWSRSTTTKTAGRTSSSPMMPWRIRSFTTTATAHLPKSSYEAASGGERGRGGGSGHGDRRRRRRAATGAWT